MLCSRSVAKLYLWGTNSGKVISRNHKEAHIFWRPEYVDIGIGDITKVGLSFISTGSCCLLSSGHFKVEITGARYWKWDVPPRTRASAGYICCSRVCTARLEHFCYVTIAAPNVCLRVCILSCISPSIQVRVLCRTG